MRSSQRSHCPPRHRSLLLRYGGCWKYGRDIGGDHEKGDGKQRYTLKHQWSRWESFSCSVMFYILSVWDSQCCTRLRLANWSNKLPSQGKSQEKCHTREGKTIDLYKPRKFWSSTVELLHCRAILMRCKWGFHQQRVREKTYYIYNITEKNLYIWGFPKIGASRNPFINHPAIGYPMYVSTVNSDHYLAPKTWSRSSSDGEGKFPFFNGGFTQKML